MAHYIVLGRATKMVARMAQPPVWWAAEMLRDKTREEYSMEGSITKCNHLLNQDL
jgi:hypothetical protein